MLTLFAHLARKYEQCDLLRIVPCMLWQADGIDTGAACCLLRGKVYDMQQNRAKASYWYQVGHQATAPPSRGRQRAVHAAKRKVSVVGSLAAACVGQPGCRYGTHLPRLSRLLLFICVSVHNGPPPLPLDD